MSTLFALSPFAAMKAVHLLAPSVWLLLLLLAPLPSFQASTLGERALTALSTDDISILVSTPDPLKNLDPSNPSSHLSKILIPRARMFVGNAFRDSHRCSYSGYRQQYPGQELYQDHTRGSQLAHRGGRIHWTYTHRREKVHESYRDKGSSGSTAGYSVGAL